MAVLEYQATEFVSYTSTGNGDGYFNVSIGVPDLSAYTITATEWSVSMMTAGTGSGPDTGQVDVNGDVVIPDLSAALTGIAAATSIGWDVFVTVTLTISGGSFTGSKYWTIDPGSAPYQLFYLVTVNDAPPPTGSASYLRQRQVDRSLRQRQR